MGGFRFNGGLSNIPNKPAHAGEKNIKSTKQILRVKSTQGDINKNTQKVKVINKSQKKSKQIIFKQLKINPTRRSKRIQEKSIILCQQLDLKTSVLRRE